MATGTYNIAQNNGSGSNGPVVVETAVDVIGLDGGPGSDGLITATGNTSTANCTNDYCVSDEEYMDMIASYIWPNPFEWGLIAFYILVFIVGLVGNFLVCLAVWRNHHMRTVTNYFIVNLAVADFLVILICLPPTVLGDVTETWFMGKAMCKVVKYLQMVSVSVSVLTLTAISLERCYAICYPLKFKPTTKMSRLTILLIWALAMVICIPELVVLDVHRSFPEHISDLLMACKPNWKDESQMAYQLFLIIALFFLPFCVMGVAYSKIAIVLWSNYIPTEGTGTCKSVRTSNGKSPAETQVIARRKAAKMLIAVVVMFGVCYLPVHLLNILRYARVGLTAKNAIYLALVSHWLCYFNSAVNPIIYNFMSEKFQKAFAEVMTCCCCPYTATSPASPYLPQSPVRHKTHIVLSGSAASGAGAKRAGLGVGGGRGANAHNPPLVAV